MKASFERPFFFKWTRNFPQKRKGAKENRSLKTQNLKLETLNRKLLYVRVSPIAPNPALAFSRMSGFSGLIRMQAAK